MILDVLTYRLYIRVERADGVEHTECTDDVERTDGTDGVERLSDVDEVASLCILCRACLFKAGFLLRMATT